MSQSFKKFKLIFFIFLFFGVFGLAKNTLATTYTAANCNVATIQALIDNASPGDTINVRAGLCEWGTTLYIRKAVKVIGAGAGVPNTIDKTYTCNPAVNTCIKTTHAATESYSCGLSPYGSFCGRELPSNFAVFIWTNSPSYSANYNKELRFSGFSINLDSITSGIFVTNYSFDYPLINFQLDNNVFTNMAISNADSAEHKRPVFYTAGSVFGVVYGNYFWSGSYGGFHNGWGDKSYQMSNILPGTLNALFMEDNYIRTTYKDSFGRAPGIGISNGKSAVFRYNTLVKDVKYDINIKEWSQNHGNNGVGGSYSGIFMEIYGNKYTDLYGESRWLVNVRGGKNMVFFNQLITPTPGTSDWDGPYVEFKECEECTGTSYSGRGADISNPTAMTCAPGEGRLYPTQNCIDNREYLCIHGRCDLPVCTGSQKAGPDSCHYVGTTANCYSCSKDGIPQHVWQNYFWNNRDGSGGLNNHKWRYWRQAESQNTPEKPVIENTHYFVDRQGVIFDGSLSPVTNIYSTSKTLGKNGVGCGTLTARPKTCTTGAGYWVTNQSCSEVPAVSMGKNPAQKISGYLTTCKSSNNWSENTASDINAGYTYVPHTYPHPLRGGTTNTAPGAPTGVKVT